jgi:predicted GNAT superfamily acetyltransferase
VETDVAVRLLERSSEHAALVGLIGSVWIDPDGHPAVSTDLLAALSHFGGYVAGAWDGDGTLAGGGYGFVGRYRGQPVLHSHTVCVAPGIEHRGIGYAIKQHQRGWAAAKDLRAVTWTFDPLVRRNAYFNITKLGACIAGYEVDLYGPLRDATNAGDETDRAVVWWPVTDVDQQPATASDQAVTVFVPDDIVALRAHDPAAARAHRMRVREELGARVTDGWRVIAMSRDGWYTLDPPGERAA